MSTTVQEPKRRFKLLKGYHQQTEESPPDFKGSRVQNRRLFKPGSIITSDRDLCKLFNTHGSTKFQELPPEAKVEKVEQKASDGPDLEAMTVRDLRDLADREEVDLQGATRKEEIVAILKKTLGL